MKPRALRFARFDRIEDYLAQGWVALIPNGATHHHSYGIELAWLCDCPIPCGFKFEYGVRVDRKEKQLRRAEIFGEQNGICYWCDNPMQLLARYPVGGTLPADACTIDRARGKRWVASCFQCNQTSVNHRIHETQTDEREHERAAGS